MAGNQNSGRKADQLPKAKLWLDAFVSGGSKSYNEIVRVNAKRHKFGLWTLRQAKKQLGLKAVRRGLEWFWEAADYEPPEPVSDPALQTREAVLEAVKAVVQEAKEDAKHEALHEPDPDEDAEDVPWSPLQQDVDRRERGLPPVVQPAPVVPIDQIQDIGELRGRIHELKVSNGDPVQIAAGEAWLVQLRKQQYGAVKPTTPADERF
jgi:hypothetical protein